MQSMYSREIETFRNQGLRLAEVGSLADRRAKPGRFLLTFAEMGRLIAQVASARKFDALVAVVHPKHARLYKRVLGFRQLGDHTDCPYANGNPAEALYLRFDDYLGTRLHDQFFCDPYPPQELHPYHWDEETRRFFRCILECDGKIAHAIGMEDYYSWGAKYPSAKLNVTAGLTSSTS